MAVNVSTAGDLLPAARDALARGDWAAARDGFRAALEHDDTATAWEGLSWAAWWLDDEQLTLSRARARVPGVPRRRRSTQRRAPRRLACVRRAWTSAATTRSPAAGCSARGTCSPARPRPASTAGCRSSRPTHRAQVARRRPIVAAAHAQAAVDLGRELASPTSRPSASALEGMRSGRARAGRGGHARLDEASALASGEDFELPISPVWTLCMRRLGVRGHGRLPARGAVVRRDARALRALGRALAARHVPHRVRQRARHPAATGPRPRPSSRRPSTTCRRPALRSPPPGSCASASCAPARGAPRRRGACSSARGPTRWRSSAWARSRSTPATPTAAADAAERVLRPARRRRAPRPRPGACELLVRARAALGAARRRDGGPRRARAHRRRRSGRPTCAAAPTSPAAS